MQRILSLGTAANAAALACLVMAFINRQDVVIKGASFNRTAAGVPGAVAGISHDGATGWIVAATAFVIVGLVVTAFGARRGRLATA
jgi:hypothetical protein